MSGRLLILFSCLIPGLAFAAEVIPEPTSMALLAAGIGALFVAKRKK